MKSLLTEGHSDFAIRMKNMTQAKNSKSTWHVQFAGIIVSTSCLRSRIWENKL